MSGTETDEEQELYEFAWAKQGVSVLGASYVSSSYSQRSVVRNRWDEWLKLSGTATHGSSDQL